MTDPTARSVNYSNWCGTMPVHRRLLGTAPAYGPARVRIEEFTFRRKLFGAAIEERETVVRIPVVVHVVWHREVENLDEEQIHNQMAVLNRDFRATNADVSSVPAVWRHLVGDTRIEFVLADITRTQTRVPAFDTGDGVKFAASGGADAWPADKYLNMWVCPLGGGLLGYAQFPGGSAETDGVVILHSAFGTGGTAAAPFDGGRTAVHEIGHWLNLRHIWGDDGEGCSGSDFVDDTPNQGGPRTGVPRFPALSCHNGPDGDMFMNYMDYTDDACMVMFTRGQTQRMDACLAGPRRSLMDAPAPADPPEALFRRWVHVREEDEQGVCVYRPADVPIPPARGRDGIEFQPDGTVMTYTAGPADAPVGSPGRWSVAAGAPVAVQHQKGRFELVSVEDDVLRLRPAE